MSTQIVYKKVNIYNDGSLHPLFIDKGRAFKMNEWMKCEYHPTTGFAPRSVGDGGKGGWHCCFQPVAPHLADQLAHGYKQVWIKCEAKGEYTVYDRPWNQGGSWILVEYIKPIAVLSEEEVYNINNELHLAA